MGPARVDRRFARRDSGVRSTDAVMHSAGEFDREQVHTNGRESHWALLKRGTVGSYHHISVKHLDRYTTEFEARHNARPADTIDQIQGVIAGMEGKRIRYQGFTA